MSCEDCGKSRRQFLQTAAATGAAIVTGSAALGGDLGPISDSAQTVACLQQYQSDCAACYASYPNDALRLAACLEGAGVAYFACLTADEMKAFIQAWPAAMAWANAHAEQIVVGALIGGLIVIAVIISEGAVIPILALAPAGA